MKKALPFLITFLTVACYGQSITVQRDTVQTLQNSDAGSVAYADIDLDGDNDLVITGSPGATTMYVNDGNGNFTAISQPAIVDVYAGAAEFADIDGDGDMDLLMTGNTSSPVATANLYLNDGSGGFSLAPATPFEASFAGDIDFGDIDGDSDLDLIMTGKDASEIVFAKLYRNNGGGSFSLIGGTPFTPVWSSATEFIDVDNDNDLDLMICGADSSGAPTANLYHNNGSGTFSLVTGLPFAGVDFGDIAFGDTDQDGDQDILLTGSGSNSQNMASLYINSGTTFNLLPNTPFPGVSLHSASFADFNNDGRADLLLLGNSTNGLIGHIYENLGSSNFVLADSSLSGSYNGSNIVADLNGDNKLDIVTTGTSFTLPVRAPKIYYNQTITVSVSDADREGIDFTLFPNPSGGLFSVAVNSDLQTKVEIFDLAGRMVLSDAFMGTKSSIYLDEPHGIYLVRLTTEGQVLTKMLELK